VSEGSLSSREIRLVCKLQPGSQGVDNIIEALRTAGYALDGNSILKGLLRAEFRATSLSGDEVMILVRSAEPDELRSLLSLLVRECWYVDVHYHLRGEGARAAAGSLGIQLPEDGVYRSRVKFLGVELRVDAYPRHSALTVSYRAGWREVNSGAAARIHEKILGVEGGRGILDKLLGWIR
jgi:hypothetical protein